MIDVDQNHGWTNTSVLVEVTTVPLQTNSGTLRAIAIAIALLTSPGAPRVWVDGD